MTIDATLADQLLDAQVRYVMGQLRAPELTEQLERDLDDLLARAGELSLATLVDPEKVKPILRRLLSTAPASVAASEAVEVVADVLHDGPAEPFTAGDLADRQQIEALLDELFGMSDLAERALDRLAASPLVGTVAARFMGRIVGEVLQANRAVAEKVPGLGSLMSFGTSAASKMMGAADKQFEALVGDTAGKGAAFAVRRLNSIVIETLRDPTTRQALLQVWDLVAQEPVVGLGHYLEREEVYELAHALQGVVATAAATDHAGALADAVVDAFYARYGELPLRTLLDELGIERDDLLGDLRALAPDALQIVTEQMVRARLQPFFASPEVAQLLQR